MIRAVMDRAAALDVLGLTQDPELARDAGQLRRAYLRAIKKHKPERDPDGFRRVRDAYELLSRASFDDGTELDVTLRTPARQAEGQEEHRELAARQKEEDDDRDARWAAIELAAEEAVDDLVVTDGGAIHLGNRHKHLLRRRSGGRCLLGEFALEKLPPARAGEIPSVLKRFAPSWFR
jgi:hypothetical protein